MSKVDMQCAYAISLACGRIIWTVSFSSPDTDFVKDLYLCIHKKSGDMTRNTGNRHAGDVPAATNGTAETAAGTFDGCRTLGSLPLTQRSPEIVPGGAARTTVLPGQSLRSFPRLKIIHQDEL
jgi:hypothetical protein